MPADARVLRYAAFTRTPDGGNPAGVVLDAGDLDAATMQRIATEVDYSESAFLTTDPHDPARFVVRYFSPEAEVPFCGHATIASAVALAERDGPGRVVFATQAGAVVVESQRDADGTLTATLSSVAPRVTDLDPADLAELLAALGWRADDLDPGLPPRIGYAGAWHPVIAAGSRDRLSKLDYDFARLASLMSQQDWTTVQLVWRESPAVFHARNPFPPGGIVEDPATGAAAAAFGAYLRALGLVEPPARVTVLQGTDMGRPSQLVVDIPDSDGSIRVSGSAVAIP